MEAAVKLGQEAGYENAGTMEFLVDKNQNYYFLEMNARLQVEHPITEQVTGIDLVRAQIRIAAGETLTPGPSPTLMWERGAEGGVRGHAIECRIYAEDPDNDFLPSPGHVQKARSPEGPGVRVDSAVFSGTTISVYYDPMIAKLISWGRDREEAIIRMERALKEYLIVGVKTNIAFHEAVLSHPDFRKGKYDTGFVERNMAELKRKSHEGFEEIAAIAAMIHEKYKKGGASASGTGGGRSPVQSTGQSIGPAVSSWRFLGLKEGLR
jgi:acetyl/propionyl-CoA carboxylase alpha subunit